MSDMTRAEAIKVLQELWRYKDTDKYAEKEIRQALSIAINSLQIDEQYDLMYEQAEPNCPFYKIDEDGHGLCKNHRVLEQEPCDDAISRDAVWDVMQELWGTSGELIDRLMDLPSVNQQEPKTGHWIEREHGGVKCSKCLIVFARPSIFCPNCGCRMVEPQESEE